MAATIATAASGGGAKSKSTPRRTVFRKSSSWIFFDEGNESQDSSSGAIPKTPTPIHQGYRRGRSYSPMPRASKNKIKTFRSFSAERRDDDNSGGAVASTAAFYDSSSSLTRTTTTEKRVATLMMNSPRESNKNQMNSSNSVRSDNNSNKSGISNSNSNSKNLVSQNHAPYDHLGPLPHPSPRNKDSHFPISPRRNNDFQILPRRDFSVSPRRDFSVSPRRDIPISPRSNNDSTTSMTSLKLDDSMEFDSSWRSDNHNGRGRTRARTRTRTTPGGSSRGSSNLLSSPLSTTTTTLFTDDGLPYIVTTETRHIEPSPFEFSPTWNCDNELEDDINAEPKQQSEPNVFLFEPIADPIFSFQPPELPHERQHSSTARPSSTKSKLKFDQWSKGFGRKKKLFKYQSFGNEFGDDDDDDVPAPKTKKREYRNDPAPKTKTREDRNETSLSLPTWNESGALLGGEEVTYKLPTNIYDDRPVSTELFLAGERDDSHHKERTSVEPLLSSTVTSSSATDSIITNEAETEENPQRDPPPPTMDEEFFTKVFPGSENNHDNAAFFNGDNGIEIAGKGGMGQKTKDGDSPTENKARSNNKSGLNLKLIIPDDSSDCLSHSDCSSSILTDHTENIPLLKAWGTKCIECNTCGSPTKAKKKQQAKKKKVEARRKQLEELWERNQFFRKYESIKDKSNHKRSGTPRTAEEFQELDSLVSRMGSFPSPNDNPCSPSLVPPRSHARNETLSNEFFHMPLGIQLSTISEAEDEDVITSSRSMARTIPVSPSAVRMRSVLLDAAVNKEQDDNDYDEELKYFESSREQQEVPRGRNPVGDREGKEETKPSEGHLPREPSSSNPELQKEESPQKERKSPQKEGKSPPPPPPPKQHRSKKQHRQVVLKNNEIIIPDVTSTPSNNSNNDELSSKGGISDITEDCLHIPFSSPLYTKVLQAFREAATSTPRPDENYTLLAVATDGGERDDNDGDDDQVNRVL
eukprot:CAMPEP_0172363270 /NCGR_PEP_ID=MMETSP1060-20121228/6681_1 /TAXON_ID=37318 /ORGANISM="Pseudo-nitzschia pungens, Strain cf. cingulata" /LENGTH=978 /DNA_ID=CAMNT_0013085985 /DNA_START=90 /DNA_END=3026 /DNA_ORIENTATION=+